MEEQDINSTNPNKKYLIIIIIAVVMLVTGIVFMVLRQNQVVNDNINNNANVNDNTNSSDLDNTNTAVVNTNTGNSILDPIAKARDADRANDIRTIMTALESYKTSHSQYPENLDSLVQAGELGSVPVNPEPGGSAYSYTAIGSEPYQSYDLCYTLETNGVENIEAGEHCATPSGITGFF